MNYGNALLELKRPAEALANYDRALRLNPVNVIALYNRGVALADLQRPQEALEAYAHVIAARPDHAHAHYGMGNMLTALHRTSEARAAFDRAIALQPDNADFHLNKAFTCLLAGDFATAWPLYEWRWQTEAVAPLRRALQAPLWRGGHDLRGKHILLHAEQGFGDTLHFCRYAPLVAARGAHAVLEVQPALVSLLRTLPGVETVIGRGDPLPPFDVQCPLLSLPLAFATTLASVPADVPYLRSDPARVAAWRSRLGERTRPRVGVAWSGSGSLEHDQRSLPLATLGDALPAGIEYIALQKDMPPEDAEVLAARGDMRNLGVEVADFADTAALIAAVDVVVTVDTAVAHLAGALAQPVWLLLPFDVTWRWLLDRDDSPWYPTARLFRQQAQGEWAVPLAAVRAALAERFG
jgi:hypothetical protein